MNKNSQFPHLIVAGILLVFRWDKQLWGFHSSPPPILRWLALRWYRFSFTSKKTFWSSSILNKRAWKTELKMQFQESVFIWQIGLRYLDQRQAVVAESLPGAPHLALFFRYPPKSVCSLVWKAGGRVMQQVLSSCSMASFFFAMVDTPRWASTC